MEKFGIFELLDTLSALLLPDSAAAPPPPEQTPKKDDAVFAPPVYRETGPAQAENPSAAALSSFLEKHEKTVKKLDGGK